MEPGTTFSQFNLKRNSDPNVFNMANTPIEYYALGLAEEAGEVCGVLKKLQRGFNAREKKKLIKSLVKEAQEKSKSLKVPVTADESMWTPEVLEAMWKARMTNKLAFEMADVYCYLDLMATRSGINLKDAIRDKFNLVSKEMDAPEYMITRIDHL